ncbi:hypothetical protein NE857_26080 [Nocardiopsis exhalans]|uniref:Uncharacterized protein n=2 Tax=Nocardiopsis TaxID=2013 RepID=A0A840WA61_9ACTN|nr:MULTISPECIES: hypothetical protein [Nocardiopsis]MBB5492263.1 hypothetical protein [Nocardiopsis metallicus]USY18726.1 hypothetical protein NE857_26080 [Nocardiopsis exhalans]
MSATALRDYFDGARITVSDLEDLDRTGPGGIIYACTRTGEYALTHTRYQTWGRSPVIIYGHGDLHHDLTHHKGDWQNLARDLTGQARDQIENWTRHAVLTPHLVGALRRDMRAHGMALNHRPEHGRTEDGGHWIEDGFASTHHPRITFQMTYIQRHRDSLLISLAMYDRGRYVTCWPERTTVTSGVPFCVREAPDRIRRHLDLHD